MRLIGVAGVMVLGAGICCGCGSPGAMITRIRSIMMGEGPEGEGVPVEAPVEAAAPEAPPVQVVTEEVQIGLPRGAVQQQAPEGVFMRYTADALSVDQARQYHINWLREHGWRVQVDQASVTGWSIEVVNDQHRLIVTLEPLGQNGVNTTFKLL